MEITIVEIIMKNRTVKIILKKRKAPGMDILKMGSIKILSHILAQF